MPIVFSISVVLLILSIILVVLFFYSWEKREWNKGICSEDGQPWEFCYTDPFGIRVYRSGATNRMVYLGISWPVDGNSV